MRDHVCFFLNGHERIVRGKLAFATLAEYLRWECGLSGTKVVCAEGDCGACTVLAGRPKNGSTQYVPVDSCIQFVFQVDGCDVVTVEGMSCSDQLAEVQQRMVDCHGSQCGYCTPGFIMAMAGWTESGAKLDDARIALTGNLCRCTGYVQILEAMARLSESKPAKLPTGNCARLTRLSDEPLLIEFAGRRFFAPTTLADATSYKAHNPETVIIAGATELGVLRNKRGIQPASLMSLGRIPELSQLAATSNSISIGANVTWADLEPVVRETLPAMRLIVERFGSPQIRHAATVVGNVVHGSPIADSLPWLCVMDAELHIAGENGIRSRSVNGFYKGYKQNDLQNKEIVVRLTVPMPNEADRLRCYKISRRIDLDISTVCAAIRLQMDGDRIESAAVACGGVAPTVVRLPKTEEYLGGREFSECTFRMAGGTARAEIAPIANVRGSADFRLQLCENLFPKFYFDEVGACAEALA